VFVYLANPYSGTGAKEHERYEQIVEVCATALKANCPIFSPINHWHPISRTYGVEGSFGMFRIQCEALLPHASCLVVITLPGWKHSVGVSHEWCMAEELSIPSFHVTLAEALSLSYWEKLRDRYSTELP